MNANTPGSNAGPMDWFNSLPKISRGYAACLVVTAACASWGMTFPFMLFLDWRSVFGGLQVWRLATHVLFSNPLGFRLLFQCIWVLTYGSTLESSTYSHLPQDYLFLFVFATGCFTLMSLIMGPLLGLAFIPYTGSSMVMTLLYVWSKEFSQQDIKLYGIVKIKGFYLPFAFMAISMLMGGKPDELMADALGILVGHVWYFFTTLLPRGTGKVYLRTPHWVKWAADKLELSRDGQVRASGFRMPPAAAVAAGRPGGASAPGGSGGGFRAFRGSANRLGS